MNITIIVTICLLTEINLRAAISLWNVYNPFESLNLILTIVSIDFLGALLLIILIYFKYQQDFKVIDQR